MAGITGLRIAAQQQYPDSPGIKKDPWFIHFVEIARGILSKLGCNTSFEWQLTSRRHLSVVKLISAEIPEVPNALQSPWCWHVIRDWYCSYPRMHW
jgi:hypothetical protein